MYCLKWVGSLKEWLNNSLVQEPTLRGCRREGHVFWHTAAAADQPPTLQTNVPAPATRLVVPVHVIVQASRSDAPVQMPEVV